MVARAESILRMRWLYVLLVAVETVVIIGAIAGKDGGIGQIAQAVAFLGLGTYWLARCRGARRALQANQ